MPVPIPRVLRLLPLLLPALAVLLAAGPARANTLTVTNTNDSGANSLRAQITAAVAGDTITFGPTVTGTITLTSGEIDFGKNLTIMGPGAGVLAVDGGHTAMVAGSRIFGITGGTVAISGLTIQNGAAPNDGAPFSASGGGIALSGGTLALTGCTLSGNASPNGNGGGVFNGGTLMLTDCTLTNNRAPSANGYGGAVFNSTGTATLTGCVLAGNGAAGGGACENNAGATLTLTGCTLTGNTAQPGGGVYNVGTVTLTDDILYGDTGGEIARFGGTLTATYCDVQQASGVFAGTGNLNADPLFVSAPAGGPYDLHLQPGSPCFQAGVDRAATDHDGQPYGSPPTLGAYEITGEVGQGYVVTNANDSGSGSLRAAVAYADANAGAIVTFDPTVFPAGGPLQTITLTTGELDITQDATITGPGAGVLAVDGNASSRIFGITAGTVAMSGLTIQNGAAPNAGTPFFGTGGAVSITAGATVTLAGCTVAGSSDVYSTGGGVANSGTLTLTDCTLSGNSGTGGAVFSDGTLTATGCAFFGNTAANGGGIFAQGLTTVTGCTFSGNTGTSSGGAVFNQAGAMTLTDDVLYGDGGGEAVNDTSPAGSGGTLTATYCDVQQASGVFAGTGNLNADPLFVSAPAGGPYDLHLQPGSPCFQAGTANGAPATDHDGVFYGSPPTIGAYEITGQAGTGYVVTNTNDSGSGSLRAAVGYADSQAGTTVTFDPAAFPAGATQTITLTTGEIDVTQGLTLTAPGTGLIVDGGGSSRVFGITGGPVSLTGLTIQNGQAPGSEGAPFFGGGGGLAVGPAGTLTLTGCTLSGNGSSVGDGGGLQNLGTLTLTDCAVDGNTAGGNGGGVNNGGTGLLTLTGGEFSNNGGVSGGGFHNDDGGMAMLTGCALGPLNPNTAGRNGGGVGNDSGGLVTLTGCTLSNNGGTEGGGVFNGGLATLTGCAVTGNGAADGGGVASPTGTLTLTADTVAVNSASHDGGGVSNGGAATLTAVALGGNNAVNDGGGLVNGGSLTLTSCSFGGNSADNGGGLGTGGAVYTVDGTATLTDDVLYGDTANGVASEIAGSVPVTYCDVQGGIDTNDAANHVFDADPLFADPATGDLHVSLGSPAIAQGTPDAPGFSPTDADGLLYYTPPTLGAYEGPRDVASDTHVLWTNPDGKTIFWDVNAQGAHLIAGTYGPYADDASGNTAYRAAALSTGPDGVSHLLWTNPDGHVYLWTVNGDGTFTPFFYGPFSDDGTANTIWQPVAVSTGGDGVTHLLWSNPDGRTILWDVQPDGTFTIAGNYDPQPGDTPVALASGPDGLSHILWNGADGTTLLWNLNASGTPTPVTYPRMADGGLGDTTWRARAVSVGPAPSDTIHLLWNNPNARTILWGVNPGGGAFTILGNYDAFSDSAFPNMAYTAVSLATGGDDRSHFAWDNPDGNTYLWSVSNADGSHADTFYPPFLDDGTTNTIWKAVAVSAGVLPPGP